MQSLTVNEQKLCQGGPSTLVGETNHNRAIIMGGERNKTKVQTLLLLGVNIEVSAMAGGPAALTPRGFFTHHPPLIIQHATRSGLLSVPPVSQGLPRAVPFT